MARIQHVALVVSDPAKTAQYYKESFNLTELNRNDHGVWLTDGYIYFAILSADSEGTPLPGNTGIHHVGFVVDDLEESCSAIESRGATPARDTTPANRKYVDPDGICVDLRSAQRAFWDKRISAATQLYSLQPAGNESG